MVLVHNVDTIVIKLDSSWHVAFSAMYCSARADSRLLSTFRCDTRSLPEVVPAATEGTNRVDSVKQDVRFTVEVRYVRREVA